MEFTVIRSKWLRGSVKISSLLLDDKRCCLGFLGQACGIKDESLKNMAYPYSLYVLNKEGYALWPSTIMDFTNNTITDACRRIIQVNDSELLLESEREKQLTSLFNSIGITIRFID